MTLTLFALMASLPALALLRLWNGRTRIALVLAFLPISIAAAFLVAAFEETQFIKNNASGIGPTPRWTVSNYWLDYDAERRQLTGSD